MGKFVMKTNEKGSRFVLKAGNGEIIGAVRPIPMNPPARTASRASARTPWPPGWRIRP